MKRDYILLVFSILCSGIGIAFSTSYINLLFITISSILLIIAMLQIGKIIKKRSINQQNRQYQNLRENFNKEFNYIHESMGKDIKAKPILIQNSTIATSYFCIIFIGEIIYGELNDASRRALLAHELAHVKKKHSFKSLVSFLPFILLLIQPFLPYLNITLNLLLIAIAAMIMLLRPINWPQEYEADLIAVEIADKDGMKNCLLNYAKIKSLNIYRDSYRHPSIFKRIKNIE